MIIMMSSIGENGRDGEKIKVKKKQHRRHNSLLDKRQKLVSIIMKCFFCGRVAEITSCPLKD